MSTSGRPAFRRRSLIAVLVVLVVAMLALPMYGDDAVETIRRHPQSRYFLFRGRPTALVGASYVSYGAWSTRDYVHMLNVAQSFDLNVFRVWNTASRWPDTDRLHPWARSSVPGAADGGPQFDLDAWHEAYFARLKDLVAKAGERNIAVEVVLLNGYENVWPLSPLHATNNIQRVGRGRWMTFLTRSDPALEERQRAVVAKVVAELNQFDNVYFEIMNEPSVFDVAWHSRMIKTILDTEAALPRKHLIAINGPEYYEVMKPSPSVVNTHYAYGDSWLGAFPMLGRMYDREVILGADEMDEVPRYSTADGGRVEAWEFLIGGGSAYNGLITGEAYDSQEADAYRRYLRNLRHFLSRFELVRMRRDTAFIRSGIPAGAFARAISEPGRQYAAYVHHSVPGDAKGPGGKKTRYIVQPGRYQTTLELRLPPGSYEAAWVRPGTGDVVTTDRFDHGRGYKTLVTPPYEIDIALAVIAK
jgi:hypothetical protein